MLSGHLDVWMDRWKNGGKSGQTLPEVMRGASGLALSNFRPIRECFDEVFRRSENEKYTF